MKTEEKHAWYVQGFDLLEKSLNGESKSPIHALRKKAMSRFLELGFPTSRDEEWRFTNIGPIRNGIFEPVLRRSGSRLDQQRVNELSLTDKYAGRLVFLNGHFVEEYSHIGPPRAGVEIGGLAAAIKRDAAGVAASIAQFAKYDQNAFAALSTAFIQDGAYLRIGDNVSLEDPVECLFVSTSAAQPTVAQPRNLFLVGENSKVTIVESYVGLEDHTYLNNIVSEIVVGRNSVVEHDKLGFEAQTSYHIGTTHVRQSAGSVYTNNALTLGGSIVRNTITVDLAEPQAESTLNGLSLATGEQIIDNHTTIDHTQPNCRSHELYKSILDGKAKGVFNGKIFVRQDAQKTDAKQTNKTLLLSDDATINTKPQLEIFADDVKCTHGAAVGQLDEEQVFYLRSRGIGERTARDILTTAFASDVIERVHTPALRERLRELLRHRLEQTRITRES